VASAVFGKVNKIIRKISVHTVGAGDALVAAVLFFAGGSHSGALLASEGAKPSPYLATAFAATCLSPKIEREPNA
jgi:fructose-1-phosphate kinase PfkB-like protein